DIEASTNTKPELTVLEEEKKQAKDILQKYGVINTKRKIIGINSLAAYGDAKCWPIGRYLEVAKKLSKEKDVFVVFIGDKKAQRVLEDNFFKNLPPNIINLAGKTDLNLLISIINEFDLFLTNDSGPMHIASALNIPIVAIFGSTCDILTGPYNGGEIINKRVECSPCFKRQCPIDFRCMLKITTDEVFEKIKTKAAL
ncbi:MAG: glycosyltransferase family 9 protein, partial [Parachlamydiales bacterium]|nr:glycosyltransferase family 9 protein [Parachlamydiales bacterium]